MANDIRGKVKTAIKYLSANDIAVARTRRYLDVPLPALGEGVGIRIHSLTGQEWDEAVEAARAEGGIPATEGVPPILAYKHLLVASASRPTINREMAEQIFDQHMTVARAVREAIDTINGTVTGETEENAIVDSFPVGPAEV